MHRRTTLTRKEFWREAVRRALSKGAVVTVAVGSILSIVLPFAPLLDPYRTEHAKFWAIFDKYSFGWISIVVFWIFVIKHFLQASYYVYETEHKDSLAAINSYETELALIRSKRPKFRLDTANVNGYFN